MAGGGATRKRARTAAPPDATLTWLLAGDPSVRWQVMRDLMASSVTAVARERQRVATEGWGARLLAAQDVDGRWAGGEGKDAGLYTPKWISTTYTLLLLRDLGLAPEHEDAHRACRLLLDHGLQRDGGMSYGAWKQSETCVTGMVLSLLCCFQIEDDRLDLVADHLMARQMDDGGWNCRLPRGATHASVHTTISVLEGLRHYELHRRRKIRDLRAAQRRGREFLLVHRLFRSDHTGRIIKPEFTRMAFPPRWHYDVLRALDHFRDVGAPRDERLAEAIELIGSKRDSDGRWPLEQVWRGKTWFPMERIGEPSRWNTLRALRVMRWWTTGSTDPRDPSH